jgi:precorrin-3B synthase
MRDLPLGPPIAPPPRRPCPRTGIVPLAQGACAVLAMAPSGRLTATQLRIAATWCDRYGQGELRLSVGRGLCIPGVRTGEAERVLALAAQAGLIVRADDSRLALVACAGAPSCASGATRTRADADRIAAAAPQLARAGITVHVSGCPKGCAHPTPADLTLIGTPDGYSLVLDGCAGDAPLARLALERIAQRLARVADRAGLATLVAEDSP